VQQERLGPAHGERRHDDAAAPRRGLAHDPRDLRRGIGAVVQARAVGGFEHQRVGAREVRRRRMMASSERPRSPEKTQVRPPEVHGLRVVHRVERQRRRMLRPAEAVGVLGLLLLQVGAVRQQDAA
jgi:hypothetical protein